MKKYGKTDSEKTAEESLQCRQIISEIVNFGVTEYQKLKLIKLLALELEDDKKMRKISNLIKELSGGRDSKKSNNLIVE
tara:strand:+ start:256 stop:492 length:237 start_codon:yes stop_codon:yes gene_type:complete